MPLSCPQCRRISPEGTRRCPECGCDLTGVSPFPAGPTRLVCRCGFTFGEVAKVVLWLLLTIVTAAVALLFYPYYLARFILQHTTWSED